MNNKLKIIVLALGFVGLLNQTTANAGSSCASAKTEIILPWTNLPANQVVISNCFCEYGTYSGVNRPVRLSSVEGQYDPQMLFDKAVSLTNFLKSAVYCQTSTSPTCSGTLPYPHLRTSGVYTFAYTEDVANLKARYSCRWDQPSHSWKSACLGAGCAPK